MNKFFKRLVLFLSIVLVVSVSISCIRNIDNSNKSGGNSNQQQEQQVDFSNLTYIAFGDSITYGANPFKNYSQIANPYPKLVSETLGFKSYYNPAVSGATLCSNSKNLYCMTDVVLSTTQHYDIVSVLLGFNDYNNSLPLGTINDSERTTIYGALKQIAEYLLQSQPNAFIFFMTPYKSSNWYNYNKSGYNLYDVAQAVKEVANKYNIPVLDMFNLGQFEVEMYNANSDGVHPSQEFFRTYTTPQIAQFIKDNYKK